MDRKDSHIQICLENSIDHAAQDMTGFSRYRFDHDALPETDLAEVDLSTTLFNKKLSAPILIGAMTGGTAHSAEINRRLAKAAERCGVGMALGSQRKMIEDASTRDSFNVKAFAPKLALLVGNLGAVQLNYGVGKQEVISLIEAVHADAFAFHLNPLQEAIQPEGNTNFKALREKLQHVIAHLPVPVLIKEVGSGISMTTAKKLAELPIAGIETAGLGGTSWSKIESLRTKNPWQQSTGELLAKWGIPTAESIVNCRAALADKVVIASGGIRNGVEVAKALALGANAAALSLPFLKAAQESEEAVVEAIETLKYQLKTVLFVAGCKKLDDIRKIQLKQTLDYAAL